MFDRTAVRTSLVALGFASLSAGWANAHPHVFAEARMEVVVSNEGTIAELRHVWRFDELFSATVLLEFDANTNLKLEREEAEAIGDVVKDSLSDFNYYTAISHDGADVPVTVPGRIHVDFRDGQLLMFFAVAPDNPLPLAGLLSFGAYDPTMYASLDFISDEDLVVEGSAPACRRAVVRPDIDEIIAQNQQTLTEAFFNDPEGNDYSRLFATRLELTC